MSAGNDQTLRLFPEMIISASNLAQPFWDFSRIYSLRSSKIDLKNPKSLFQPSSVSCKNILLKMLWNIAAG